MNTLSLVNILFAIVSTAVMAKTDVKSACKSGNFRKILKANPQDVKSGDLQVCFKTVTDPKKNLDKHLDKNLAAIIRRFPDALPTGKKFKKAAEDLYTYSYEKSLRALLSDGRCTNLKPDLRNFYAENNMGDICSKGGPSPIIPGLGKKHRRHGKHGKNRKHGKKGKYADVYDYYQDKRSGVKSDVSQWTRDKVSHKVNLLSRISMKQAAVLGLTNHACKGFTAEHFKAKGAEPHIVASLSIRCFRDIPAEAFAGLTREQIRKITAWPFIRRKQIAHIRPKAIVALPFDQLGVGKQTKMNMEKHVCFGITKEQMKAIKKDSKAKRAYNGRCIRSAAPGFAPSGFMVGLAVALAFALF